MTLESKRSDLIMPSNQECKLNLLPFPQRWENGNISLRVVVLPRGNPLAPLMDGLPSTPDSPAFADSSLHLKAMLIPSLEEMPEPGAATFEKDLGITTPIDMRSLYEILNGSFDIDPTLEKAIKSPRRSGRQIKKLLVPSYRNAFAFSGPRNKFAVLDESYSCALGDPCRLKKPPGPHPRRTVVWGRIIAQALRQPVLANKLGLLYETKVKLPDKYFFKDGGWLYLNLTDSSDFATQLKAKPELLGLYAARIPPLESASRNIFAAMLFPVSNSPPAGNFDELFAEVASYDDGFAKIVHCAQQTTVDLVGLEKDNSQPAFADTGVMLGWDDEQVLTWLNRQIADPLEESRDSPVGVMGYRIDVREKAGPGEAPANWTSLMRAEADLIIKPDSNSIIGSGHAGIAIGCPIGHFKGELTVETKPVQLDNEAEGNYWLPTYFTQWKGHSLVVADALAMSLSGVKKGNIKGTYKPLGGDDVPLLYGRSYEFRVRLADISGGGPGSESKPEYPAPAPVAECLFRRHISPGEILIRGLPPTIKRAAFNKIDLPVKLEIFRPRLAYPAAVFTGASNAQKDLEDDLKKIMAGSAGSERRLPGISDPDVELVQICVQVASPELDPANDYIGHPPLRNVYTVTRKFPLDLDMPIEIELVDLDASQIEDLDGVASGPIQVPTARDVVITFKALCKEDPDLLYFGSDNARVGRSTDIRLRCKSKDESKFFSADMESNKLRAIFLQQDEATTKSLLSKLFSMGKGEEAETDILSRLAAELGLIVNGTTLKGTPGRRIVFGCSSAIPHTIAPDCSEITFSSKADLILRWISVINVKINRDWTWNGARDPAIQFQRSNSIVGSVRLPMSVNPLIFSKVAGSKGATGTMVQDDDNIDRSCTEVFFFDAVYPKPVLPQKFPHELFLSYTVTPMFRHKPDIADWDLANWDQANWGLELSIKLPIAVPPNQTPKLASAGIALSPYTANDDYSSTGVRQRLLWMEFDEPPANPVDTYFARVLSCAPDPMLSLDAVVNLPPEPPLPVDPEHIRVIHPSQSDDGAGLDAMQQLIRTDSPRHFLMPLPPGLHENSRELFGFFVYELRVGHLAEWSLARARYGPPLRVTGVQHPAPPLHCSTMRTAKSVRVSAQFATPVFNGVSLLPRLPATQLWMLLYAQVMQADASGCRNLLLSRKQVYANELLKQQQHPQPDFIGSVAWTQEEIEAILKSYLLPANTPLSAMAVELLPELGLIKDPLGKDLGKVRILRTSNLTKVSGVCITKPCPQ